MVWIIRNPEKNWENSQKTIRKKSRKSEHRIFPRFSGASGPEKLTIWVKFCVESEFQVENAQKMRPDPEN